MARPLPIASPGTHCWSAIGVFSKAVPSCPTLREVVHCQNCEVYSTAGRALLERAVPRGYADEWTHALRVGKQDEQVETMSILVFRIATEWLGLPVTALVEVADVRKIHALPHRSDSVLLGLVNVRGRIQICCSLAALLGIAPGEGVRPATGSLAYRRMIVAGGDRWVLPVDEIDGVRRFRPRHVRDKPVTVARDRAHFTSSVVELDESVLLHSERGEAALPSGRWQIGCLDPERVFEALGHHVFPGATGDRGAAAER